MVVRIEDVLREKFQLQLIKKLSILSDCQSRVQVKVDFIYHKVCIIHAMRSVRNTMSKQVWNERQQLGKINRNPQTCPARSEINRWIFKSPRFSVECEFTLLNCLDPLTLDAAKIKIENCYDLVDNYTFRSKLTLSVCVAQLAVSILFASCANKFVSIILFFSFSKPSSMFCWIRIVRSLSSIWLWWRDLRFD